MSLEILQVKDLGKSYPLVFRRRDRLRAMWNLLIGAKKTEVSTILSEVSFKVLKGQSLGVIGENGAGKSTLLKLITGILTPTSGSVKLNGSVAALIELGAGFHPEYTGRENIKMAAALMGMSSRELEQKWDAILAFADIGRYIDEPIKHYSSGMVVRLGFALVANRRPDLLITDEVLAVGDESFQRKCVRWIEEYLNGGGTLILVSHSMYHIQKLCKQALWIQNGKIEEYGDVFDVTQKYLSSQEAKFNLNQEKKMAVDPSAEFSVTDLKLNNETHSHPIVIQQNSNINVKVEVESRANRDPKIAIGIVRSDGSAVYGVSSEMDQSHGLKISESKFLFEIDFPALPLLPGSYCLRAHAMDSEAMRLFDTVEQNFIVRGESREFGFVRLAHEWR